ncbi:hypothetical protein WJX74_008367 [Apatococcus lobatus]|uniref:NYN domain-containing protein n=1 Tax=Apatococcus lobatus TaxID=904363 RepID=A0AAW1QWX2_9CHLO
MEPAVSLCRAVKAGRAPSQAEAGCRPSGDQFLRKAAASFLLSAPPKSSLVLLSGDAGFKGRAEQAKKHYCQFVVMSTPSSTSAKLKKAASSWSSWPEFHKTLLKSGPPAADAAVTDAANVHQITAANHLHASPS